MRTVHVWLRWWLLAAAMGVTHAATADVAVGSVLAVRGAVFRDSGSGLQPLAAKATVERGDSIVSKAGKARISLADGTVISIGENTRIRLADYQGVSAATATRLALVAGALRLLVNRITPTGRFEVETETAVAAVRGTDWVVEATSEVTSVVVVSGAIAVSSRGAQAQSTVVLDTPGAGTDVPRGSAPTPPVKWAAQRYSATLARATFE